MKSKIQDYIFYPFILALYFPLFLLLNNLHQLPFISGIRAMIVSVLGAAILLVFLKLILKSWHRAALLTGILIVLFYIYGYFRQLVPDVLFLGKPLSYNRYMYPFWGLVMALATWASIKLVKNPQSLTRYLNIISLVLLIMAVVQGLYAYNQRVTEITSARHQYLGVASIVDQLSVPDKDSMRDIYYILIDGYSRADILQDEYGFDNSDFISELEKRGFYIADCSSSNYPWTSFSLGSTFNMDYIPPVGSNFLGGRLNWRDFGVYLGVNNVNETLKELGYTTVTFDTAFPWMKVTEPDYYITTGNKTSFTSYLFGRTSEFENLLMDLTLLVRRDTILNRLFGIKISTTAEEEDDPHKGLTAATRNLDEMKYMYDLFKYGLEQLPLIPDLPGRKYVYAHMMSVHRPFLFNQEGEFEPGNSLTEFINSTIYTNKTILAAIDQIIAKTDPKPIIILQGDHSRTGAENQTAILNAYYFPDAGTESLYPTISPVNTFRVIFNTYFGAQLPLLEDKSFLPENNDFIPYHSGTSACP